MVSRCGKFLPAFCLPLGLALFYAPPAWPQQQSAVGGSTPAFLSAAARQRDAETFKALSAEGQLLFSRDKVKLEGYQYCDQAVSLAERGELRLSIRAASRALYLGQRQGNEDLVAVSERDFAIAYSYAGDLDRADEYARKALQHPGKDPTTVAAPAYKVLGDVAGRRGKHAEAIGFYNQALAVASERFKPLVRLSLANAYIAEGRAQEARAAFEQMPVPEDNALRQPYERSLGNLFLAEGKPADALKHFEAVTKGARGLDSDYHHLWAQEGIGRSYLALGDKASALKAYLQAVDAADRVRAQFRSEEFKTGLFGDLQQIFERALALAMDAGQSETGWRLSEASRSRALLDVVRERVPVSSSATASPLTTEPLALDVVRGALRDNEAIVEFHTLDDRLYAWVLRRGGVKAFTIVQPRQAVDKLVDEFRQSIFERKRTAADYGQRLYAMLLQPLGLARGERLLIVPHGALHYMPFQALREGDEYLIQRHPLAVAPSASIAVQLSRQGRLVSPRLVAFGNPANEEKYALPGSEREIQKIGTLFQDKSLFLQEEASRATFKGEAGTGRILHVAAHAEVDEVDPLASRILLAREGKDPGYLEAREVYGLDLKQVSLVTISACESGLGRIARGDEILGFTRSFFTAGASGLIVSLWPVSDNSTELLMSTLYQDMAKGKEVLDAMQAAQVAVLKTGRYAHPFYWAPFNFVGDWRMRIQG